MLKNGVSVDVEEFYHAHNLADVAPRKSWKEFESRVEKPTQEILDLFDKHQIKATFFILGEVAKNSPDLIKEIANRGHELGSHGYHHYAVYDQTQKEFAKDILSSKEIIENISGQSVRGYRAPSFSITRQTSWAYEELVKAGYSYDSSLYPIKHHRYGNRHRLNCFHQTNTPSGSLRIAPLATTSLNLLGKQIRLPTAGGAYWRLFPIQYTRWALRQINKKEKRPFICYFHPWELDTEQPKFTDLSKATTIRHYGGQTTLKKKISLLLKEFRFTSVWEVLNVDD